MPREAVALCRAAECGLVGAHRCSKPHYQRVAGQLVADRGFGEARQSGGQRRQIVEVQIVADIDDQPKLGGGRSA